MLSCFNTRLQSDFILQVHITLSLDNVKNVYVYDIYSTKKLEHEKSCSIGASSNHNRK